MKDCSKLSLHYSVQIVYFSILYSLGLKELLVENKICNADDILCSNGLELPQHIVEDESTGLILLEVIPGIKKDDLRRSIRQMHRFLPNAAIVLFSQHFSEEAIMTVFDKGVRGYFLLSEKPEKILEVIKAALCEETKVSDGAMAAHFKKERSKQVNGDGVVNFHFSKKEEKVLILLAKGESTEAIRTKVRIAACKWDIFLGELAGKLGELN